MAVIGANKQKTNSLYCGNSLFVLDSLPHHLSTELLLGRFHGYRKDKNRPRRSNTRRYEPLSSDAELA